MIERLLARGGPQTKKLAFLGVIGAGIIWLTIGLWVPLRPEWNVAFGLLLAAGTGGYVGGKAIASRLPPSSVLGAKPEDQP